MTLFSLILFLNYSTDPPGENFGYT